jgi:alpha-glucan,water dikinase
LSSSLETASSKEISKVLASLRQVVMTVVLPEDDESLLKTNLAIIGCSAAKWPLAWNAIRKVWASKFNERVFLSTLKARIDLNLVVMSVLCQEVISGEYAFVLHTKNPFNSNVEELYAELVLGLGETLVGAYEGRALSFIVHKNTLEYEVTSFCSKSIALRGSGFIFRSDSNSEDLPGFAGAGLFDSFVMEEAKSETLNYKTDKIMIDKQYRENIIRQLALVGVAIEQVFEGEAQDVEGVVSNGKVFIVQSRPQV